MKRLLSLMFVGLITLIGWFGAGGVAPSLAEMTARQAIAQDEVIGPDSATYSNREDAYDKAVQAVNDPNGAEKEFEKDLDIYRKENPDQANAINNAIESAKDTAKDVANKITGKE